MWVKTTWLRHRMDGKHGFGFNSLFSDGASFNEVRVSDRRRASG